MNTTQLTFRQLCLSVAFLIAGAVTTALAVPPGQVLRNSEFQTFSGPCCFSFNETVAVVEPAKPTPVVVTWSATTGATFADEFVGLIVNGGPCRFYGSGSIPEPGETWNTHASLWIVYPTDGLRAGTNTFTLCGGGAGAFADSAIFHVMADTLTVRLSN